MSNIGIPMHKAKYKSFKIDTNTFIYQYRKKNERNANKNCILELCYVDMNRILFLMSYVLKYYEKHTNATNSYFLALLSIFYYIFDIDSY